VLRLWVRAVISFAIIFPLTNSLNETFKRREAALSALVGRCRLTLSNPS
jgi:hypothetical protein